ncbi:MAG: L-ectoine synthase [Parasphingorhabdus sp.]|jgi:L-ectoine synthase
MLIKSFQQVEASGEIVPISHGKSTAVRVLLKSDGMGFSLSEARCGARNRSSLWYKNHWEANYVRAGSGSLIDRDRGKEWPLKPGDLYCVGPNDRHSVANSDDPLRIISVFNPPIEGPETHDEDGAYPPTGELPPRTDPMFVRGISDVRAAGGEKILVDGNVRALRLLTSHDQMGFSLSEVHVKASSQLDLWYKHHWEANLVLEGELLVTHRQTGEQHKLSFGDVYCVGPNDPHRLEPQTDVKLLAIFNPPLNGDEKHDADGAYPPTGPVPSGPG